MLLSGMKRGYGCLVIVGIVVAIIMIIPNTAIFGYLTHKVDATEVGVRTVSGRFDALLGPDVYTSLELFADITNVKVSGVPFTAKDEEVLTIDQQRIGVDVAGMVFRPGIGKLTPEKWTAYRTLYLDDTQLLASLSEIAKQAMKVCVGGKTFKEAAVGAVRNDLTACIDEQLTALVSDMGLDVKNVTVPNIVLGDAVRKNLDAITESKGQTERAIQDRLRAEEEARRDLAVEQGKIKVEEGKRQESLRQQTESAKLAKANEDAQRQVVLAKKETDLAEAQKGLEIAKAKRETAIVDAEAATANEKATAQIFEGSPIYAAYLQAKAYAEALGKANLVIMPAGSNPVMVLGNGAQPVIPIAEKPTEK